LLESEESGKALAYLTSVAKAEPRNLAVSEKLLYTLMYRDWALPVKDLGKEGAQLVVAALAIDGGSSLALYSDGIAQIRGLATDSLISFVHGVKGAKIVLFGPLCRSVVILGPDTAGLYSFPAGNAIIPLL